MCFNNHFHGGLAEEEIHSKLLKTRSLFCNDLIRLFELKHKYHQVWHFLQVFGGLFFFERSRSTLNKVTLQPNDPSLSKHSLCHQWGTCDPFCVLAYIAAIELCSQHSWYPEGGSVLVWANGSCGAQRKYWRRPRTRYGCGGLCRNCCESLCVNGSTPTPPSPNPRCCQHRGIILISMKSAL